MTIIRQVVSGVSVCVVNLAVAVLAVLNCRPFVHWLHGRAESANWLGSTDEEALALSDQTIRDLLFGGSFQFGWYDEPFYNAKEIAHLTDVQALVWGLLALATLAAPWLTIQLGVRRWRPGTHRAIWWGNVCMLMVLAGLALAGTLAFDASFTLFHEIFFPQGNYQFHGQTDMMVQLYPDEFWQGFAGAVGVVVIILAVIEAAVVCRRRTLRREE